MYTQQKRKRMKRLIGKLRDRLGYQHKANAIDQHKRGERYIMGQST